MNQISLRVIGYPDSDDEDRAGLAWSLQEDLVAAEVEVSRPAGEAPPGAKGSALEWVQLLVSLAGAIPPLVSAIDGWMGRNPGSAIALEVDGDRLELADATPEERRAAIEMFLRRHDGG